MVEVLGYGGDAGNGSQDQKPDDNKRQQRSDEQDPNNRVQVLAVGDLTETQRKQLVEQKQRSAGN
jgi:hypothetical protein